DEASYGLHSSRCRLHDHDQTYPSSAEPAAQRRRVSRFDPLIEDQPAHGRRQWRREAPDVAVGEAEREVRLDLPDRVERKVVELVRVRAAWACHDQDVRTAG